MVDKLKLQLITQKHTERITRTKKRRVVRNSALRPYHLPLAKLRVNFALRRAALKGKTMIKFYFLSERREDRLENYYSSLGFTTSYLDETLTIGW